MLVPPTPVGSEEGIASQGWGITMRSIVFRGGIASQSEAFPKGGSLKLAKSNCHRQFNQKTDRLQASLRRFCLFWLLPLRGGFCKFGGERGIRTPDTLLGYTRFPGGPVQPLLHLSFFPIVFIGRWGCKSSNFWLILCYRVKVPVFVG